MKTINWKLRPFKKGDETGIINLDRRVFFEQTSDRFFNEYWAWEFIKNPDGEATIWLADDHGEIVGHYAVIPRLWKIEENLHMGSIVVDVMTDERYRFQGMFAALGKTSLSDSGGKGILFSYGFPVRKDVMPGHLKVGWKHIFDIPVLVYPQNFIPVILYYLKNQTLSLIFGLVLNLLWVGYRKIKEGIDKIIVKKKTSYLIYEINQFSKDFDLLWQRASSQFPIIASRTQQYLNWRYIDHPYHQYQVLASYIEKELVGYIVFRKENILGLKCGVIVDLLVDPDHFDALDLLIFSVKTQFKSDMEIALTASMISKPNPYYDLLIKHGFILSPKKFGFITHKNIEEILVFNYNNLYNQAGWLLTWGDTDVI